MKLMQLNRLALSLAIGTALLAACGGNDDPAPVPADPPVAGTDVPTSATTSSAGAFTFVSNTSRTSDNTAEPLVLGDATLAKSETDEPDPSI